MSVLECDRAGCGNIMCDRLSHTYGYICNDCFDELLSVCHKVNVSDFMATPKDNDVRNRWKEFCQQSIEEEFTFRD